MTFRNSISAMMVSSFIPVLTIGLFLMTGAVERVAGQIDTASYYLSGSPVVLDIYLDSMGLYAPSASSNNEVYKLLGPIEVPEVRDIGQGMYVAGLPAPLSREEIVALSRLAVLVSGGEITEAGLAVRPPQAPDPVIVTDQFIVQFLPGVTETQIDSLNALHGVDTVRQLNVLVNDYLLTATSSSSLDALGLAELYGENPLVVFASPDFIARHRERGFIAADELFSSQWHLHNSNDADIDAPEAWAMTRGSSDVVIAIFEPFGFDVNNADIAANLVHAWSFKGCTTTDDFGVLSPCGQASFTGKLRHGTAVAGLAAAKGDNGEGVSGACPDCRLMLIEMPTSDAAIAETIKYAEASGASVINNSWGRDISNTLTVAAFNAVATTGRNGDGVVVVWGVWDKDEDRCVGPNADLASLETSIAVASSNNLDTRAEPTGRGACIDLLAPGYMALIQENGDTVSRQGLTTTDRTGSLGYNHLNPDPMPCLPSEPTTETNASDYTRCFSGASAAGPVVSGVVGLMLSHRPCLTRAQVQQILRETADKIDAGAVYDPVTGHSERHGYGRVNAASALTAASTVSCGGGRGGTTTTTAVTPSLVEVGVRLGVTYLSGGTNDQVVLSAPGGGPLARPMLYADWHLINTLYLETQLGFTNVFYSGNTPDDWSLGAALQPSVRYNFGGVAVYLGGNIALDRTAVGSGAAVTEWGFGGAFGFRYKPRPFIALRVETLYRNWTTATIHEFGLAIAAGVIL